MNYLLVNLKSHNGAQDESLKELYAGLEGKEYKEINVLEVNYDDLFKTLKADDEVVLVGGDGTLNHFVNDVDGKKLPCNFYYYAAGTGNDFKTDMADKVVDGKILLNGVIENLPTVIVNGITRKFINGIGYGIDGYCCEVADDLQAKSDKPINYTSIAIKGLLFHYKAPNAKVTVDGVTKEYKKVWLSPVMKGRYYGGGMMVAPKQDRFNEEGLLTNVVMHKSGKISTLMHFPKIFKGEHVKYEKTVDIRSGKEFKVEFDKPTALQIDGETVRNVTEFTVHI